MMISSLYERSLSFHNHNKTNTYLTTYTSRQKISFCNVPKIISPHFNQRITTLDIDNTNEGRFLLCGSRDGTISVYDLSLLGSEYYINQDTFRFQRKRRNNSNNNNTNTTSGRNYGDLLHFHDEQLLTFRPICHSQRVHSNNNRNHNNNNNINIDPTYLPLGHSCPITKVQWYTIDSGIFLSSDCLGNIFVWDSNLFTPASCLSLSKVGNRSNNHRLSGYHHTSRQRYNHGIGNDEESISTCTINSFDMPKYPKSHMQLAVGCTQTNSSSLSLIDDRSVYLCDIKSGATTQQLIGHGVGHGRFSSRGVTNVQWSPVDEFILVSSGGDGCIKVWDVRKSGSTACLNTFDQEMRLNSVHLMEYEQEQIITTNFNSKRLNNFGYPMTKRRKQEKVAPGNYSKVECAAQIQSHDGPVLSFSFTPDGEYIVSASPSDGLRLWHLQRGYNPAILMPTSYLGPNSLKHPLRKKQRNVPMIITQPGSNKSGTVWLGNSDLLGYNIHGMGGLPNKILSGHIDDVTAIASQDKSMRLFTGGADGMILSWGCPDTAEEDSGSPSF